LEKIGKGTLGNFFSRGLELPDCERADVLGGKSISLSELARYLGLVHGSGARETPKLNKEIQERECDNKRCEHRDADNWDKPALVQRVNDVLKTFT
jgi:hypothetical protein